MSQITSTQVKYYKSDSPSSDGGDISSDEIVDAVLNNLFEDVPGDDTVAGVTNYKKIFIKNTNPDTQLQGTKVWIDAFTDSEYDEIHISSCSNLTGSDPVADGQNYVQPDSEGHVDVLDLGDLNAGDYAAVWIKRVVDSGAELYDNNSCKLKVFGAYDLA